MENLTKNVDGFMLGKVFEKVGRVMDAYILGRKSRKSKKKFRFARFEDEECAVEAIKRFDLEENRK